jgi:transcriptional regulator with XRE-family HTH domain
VAVEEIDFKPFFRALGARLRQQRLKHRLTQEDMIQHGFSARHWQQIEAGRPITLTTLLRASHVFGVSLSSLLRGMESEAGRRSRRHRSR